MYGLRRTIMGIGAVAALVIVSLAPVSHAAAQQLCLVRDHAIDKLAKQYGEAVTARGITQNGKGMVEILTSEKGSWTLVITDINGRSCIVSNGEAWSDVKAPRGQAS